MNRAVRRQQLKEPKPGSKRPARSAMPRTGPRTAGTARRSGIRGLIPQFILDVWSELQKVVWPSRDDVVHLTIVIVIVTLLIGAALGGIDIAFGWFVDKTLLT